MFAQVNVVEGPKGSCLIRNLSTHFTKNEEQAQSWLQQGFNARHTEVRSTLLHVEEPHKHFLGQANRKIAETPMNQRSSRSHAVFTIYLSAKKKNSDVIVK